MHRPNQQPNVAGRSHRIARLAGVVFGTFAAWLATVGLLLWLTGRILSDRYVWSQFLLWIPTPVALGIALLGLIAALRPGRSARQRQRRRIRWAAALALLMIYFGFIEHRLLRTPPAVRDGLHIVHWNCWPEEHKPTENFLGGAFALDPDILILTDAWAVRWWRQSFEWAQEHDGVVRLLRPFSIISRVPILTARHIVSSDEINIVMLEFDATEQLGRTLTVYAVDMPSDLKLSRMDLAREARRLLDKVQQPDAVEPDDESGSGITAPAGLPDIVIGDFNITRNSAAMRAMFPDLRHAFSQAGHGYGATFYRIFPLYHIDHVLLSESLSATRYDIIDLGVARHRAQSVHIVPREQ